MMYFCYIALNYIQTNSLKKIHLGSSINSGGHYFYPIKNLGGTGHLPHLFVVHDLYHHNYGI